MLANEFIFKETLLMYQKNKYIIKYFILFSYNI